MTSDSKHEARIHIGVVGAGTMGQGIVQLFAQAGHRLSVFDAFDGAVPRAISNVTALIQRGVAKGRYTQEQADARLNRMVERMKQAGSRDGQDKTSDECMEMRRALGEAVRNGEITREEAGQKWKESDCGS